MEIGRHIVLTRDFYNLSSNGLLSQQLIDWSVSSGKFLILLGMVGVGLSTNLKLLTKTGIKPLVLGCLGA